MTELEQLELALKKLSTCGKPEQRPVLVRAVLLWGARTHGHIKTIESLLTRQLAWLDANEGHAAYETYFADWISNLRLYERSCDALVQAQSLGELAA